MTREQILLTLQQEYTIRREDDLRAFEEKTERACARCPGLRTLLDARHAAVLSGLRASLISHGENANKSAGLPQTMAEFNRRIANALRDAGLPEDELQPTYICPICRDEGYIYTPSRRMCECLEKELSRRVVQQLSVNSMQQTFENYDETIFSDEPISGGPSQRQVALFARKVCMRYADDYPNTETCNLLLTGQSGLGKTYLLNCIACRVAERGVTPFYTSAYHLLGIARQAYFENRSELLSDMINANLLLIDDLGTEPLMQNVTISQLFNLLNERQLAGRHTIVATNLTVADLRERYTERVTSRLLDATCWRKLALTGQDVRRNLKRGSAKA